MRSIVSRLCRVVALGIVLLPAACGKTPRETGETPPSLPGTEANAGEQAGSNTDESETQSRIRPSAAQPSAARPNLPSREQFEAGWIRLFDGHSLFGWKANSDANWKVADGVISADAGGEGLLVTTVPFADYELKCDFRLEKGGNSGVFLRTPFQPKSPVTDCYELNMCDTHPSHPTGSLVGRQVADVKVSGEGEWKSWHVTVNGKRIVARLEGRAVLDFTDETENFRPSGYIGLQKRDGRIEFKNVLLKPLGVKPIFTGKDLTGWRRVPGSKGEFTVQRSRAPESGLASIRLKGGPGYLESEDAWADFILQCDAKTNTERVNSGIFFRTIAGTNPADGYELQIHNGFAEGDRTKPNDYGEGFGTGAIFRRQKARYVVPDDGEWFTLTLVARGNRFATWVNGYQVTDWTDSREEHENPRRGLRLKAGRLSLQAHDPGCDVEFRNLRIAAFPGSAESE